MNKIVLETKRSWNWKVFLVLAALVFPAAFAILPYSLHLLNAYQDASTTAPGWGTVVTNALINSFLTILLGGIGLAIANSIGLGMPFVEGWTKRTPVLRRMRGALAIGIVAGVGLALSYFVLQNLVFGPPMLIMFEEIGYAVPEASVAPPVYGFLAALSAGITEETVFRLFGLSLLAWMGGLLFQDAGGRPKMVVFWAANFIFAVSFGAAHLPAASAMGWPINTLVVTRTLVVNGIGGLVLGWLYWRVGLETAMFAHFFGDLILFALLPIVALQEGTAARYIALAGVVMVLVLTLVWALRTLIVTHRKDHELDGSASKEVSGSPFVQRENLESGQSIFIRNLTMNFGAVRALDNLSLEVPKGTIFGFLGPNGAGKTTTIRLLLGLLEPTDGQSRVMGFDPQTQPDRIRACTGALLEHTGIYEQMSAQDNLEFYARVFRTKESERKARIKEQLTDLDLWGRREERAGNWSRGMKQKLALARTLLHRPRLVLLDEPTAGLDVRSAAALREDLASLASREDVTIFLTTHNMADAERLCSLVAVIQEGRLLALDSPNALRAQVGGQRVEITGRGFSQDVLNRLQDLSLVDRVVAQNGNLVIDLSTQTDIADIVSMLVTQGAQVEGVRRGKASLEDAFLALTGGQNV